MKKILLFLIVFLLLPHDIHSQKKCAKNYCPWPEKELRSNSISLIQPTIFDLRKIYYTQFQEPRRPSFDISYYKRYSQSSLFNFDKSAYKEWHLIRFWKLRIYVGYYVYYIYGEWPVPRTLGLKVGKLNFQWKN